MKNSIIGIALCFLLILTGCRNYEIAAESGSKWINDSLSFYIVISNGNYGTGTLTIEDKTTEFECHFGPGVTEFTVFALDNYHGASADGDSWLFRGEYRYDERRETITLDITEDQIGLKANKIVLHKMDESMQ